MTLLHGRPAAYAALLLAALFWASSFPALKIAFSIYDPMVVLFFRMLLGCLCLIAFSRNFSNVNYRPGDWKLLLFMSICEPGLYFIFESSALQYTEASQAGMICAMAPLMVAIAARFILKEPFTRRTATGFIMAIAGAALLSLLSEKTDNAPNPVLGNFLEFMAMVCTTGYMITLKFLSDRYNPWFLTMVQAAVGTVFFFPLLFLPTTVPPVVFDPVGIGTIVFLGIVVTVGGYGLYNVGMSRLPAGQASAFINLIPVFTLLLSWLLLGERLSLLQYACCGLVLAGVWHSQGKNKNQS
ncbi:DMT family transporter [Pseudodesulfovibrio senegalensis]|jgi:drug/metabolite transporter (DMT)-like permease|uniref:DMT family transporter n=1 Tax=Pseudodesulfovibrio senegalensis TaxID=1721087 RepID=A0A6N6N4C9_9BACT|nr:DMT family transporter [Pseudodesulfovibrio senegalensis]KAB1442360.1 DMT family transporter [Pseudodesulfovibrio senegalensis]